MVGQLGGLKVDGCDEWFAFAAYAEVVNHISALQVRGLIGADAVVPHQLHALVGIFHGFQCRGSLAFKHIADADAVEVPAQCAPALAVGIEADLERFAGQTLVKVNLEEVPRIGVEVVGADGFHGNPVFAVQGIFHIQIVGVEILVGGVHQGIAGVEADIEFVGILRSEERTGDHRRPRCGVDRCGAEVRCGILVVVGIDRPLDETGIVAE